MNELSEEDRAWYIENVVKQEEYDRRFEQIVKGGRTSSGDGTSPAASPPFIFFYCPRCSNSVEVASRHIDERFAVVCRNAVHPMVAMKRGGE